MKLTVKSVKENPLLRRKEMVVDIVFTGPTPSKETIRNEIASQQKVHADVVDIKEIKTAFGHQQGKATLYIYKDATSKKEMVELNKKHVEKLKKAEEAKKAKPE
jgi:ribosomal protein S24E